MRLAVAIILLASVAYAVPTGTVVETSFTFSSAYANVWETVSGTQTLTDPNGVPTTIGIFFSGTTNTFKARFTPAVVGNWTWTASITDGVTTTPYSGSFAVTASSWRGFIQKSAVNSRRWTTQDGQAFNPIGIQDCIQSPLVTMSLDNADVSTGTYFNAFQTANVNVWRLNVDNCSFSLYDTIATTGNVYRGPDSLNMDTIATTIQNHGMHIYFTLFGFSPPFPTGATASQLQAIERYVKYIVDRYGAMVDFWELSNEHTQDANWYNTIATYLKAYDPYNHPISTSWSVADVSGPPVTSVGALDIISPHWYIQEPDNQSDEFPAWKFRDWKALIASTPVFVGEHGNSNCNWDATSAVRMRIRAWSTLFNEGATTFWHTGFSQSYCPGSGAANIWLGPTERSYLQNFAALTANADPTFAMTGTMSGDSGTLPLGSIIGTATKIRAYGLRSNTREWAYVTAFNNHSTNTTNVSIVVNPPQPSTVTYYNPSTAAVITTQSVAAGSQELVMPPFLTDVFVAIEPIQTPPPPPGDYTLDSFVTPITMYAGNQMTNVFKVNFLSTPYDNVRPDFPITTSSVNLTATLNCGVLNPGCFGSPPFVFNNAQNISFYVIVNGTVPGNYTFTLRTTANSIVHTVTVPVTILPMPAPITPPVITSAPALNASALTSFNADMLIATSPNTSQARCTVNSPQPSTFWAFGTEQQAWYYDGAFVYFETADYTNDVRWKACAFSIADGYAVYATGGGVPGFRVFSQGLRRAFLETGDPKYTTALQKLIDLSAFHIEGGQPQDDVMRETAYMLRLYVDALWLNSTNGTSLTIPAGQPARSLNYLLAMFQTRFQGTVTTTQSRVAESFFDGVALEALQYYYDHNTPDTRIPITVKQALDWGWLYFWNGTQIVYNPFPLNLGNPRHCDTSCQAYFSQLTGLYYPAFWWYWRLTGDTTYLTQGDAMFNHAVDVAPFSGKESSQFFHYTLENWALRNSFPAPPPVGNVTWTGHFTGTVK